MTDSMNWDSAYRANTHMSRWPWSDVVSAVCRHWRSPMPPRVLELGCGAGANIPFFLGMGADYHGCDGSGTAVGGVLERFPGTTIACCDFTVSIPFAGPFDLIIDRASVTHNTTAAIQSCLRLVHGLLAPGGRFIGVDWFSVAHSEYPQGEPGGDVYTRTGYTAGQFAGIGRVHFSDEAHIHDLFKEFEVMKLEEKIIKKHVGGGGLFASWNLVAGVRGVDPSDQLHGSVT